MAVAPARGSADRPDRDTARRIAITARTHWPKRRRRRNALVQVRQLEMRVRVDERRQDGDMPEIDRLGNGARRRSPRCDRRQPRTHPRRIGSPEIGSSQSA